MGPPSSASSSRIYSTLDVHGRPVNNGRTIKSAPKPSGLTSHKKRRVAATAAHRNGHIGQRDTTVSTSAVRYRWPRRFACTLLTLTILSCRALLIILIEPRIKKEKWKTRPIRRRRRKKKMKI